MDYIKTPTSSLIGLVATDSAVPITNKMRSKLAKLPTELLLFIIIRLSVADFLSLGATCKKFQSLQLEDEFYWKHRTLTDFRFPSLPADLRGEKYYYNLYRRLTSEGEVFLWGQHNYLPAPHLTPWVKTYPFPMPSYATPPRHTLQTQAPSRRQRILRPDLPHPFRFDHAHPKAPRLVSDLQMGGFSTTMLDNYGVLWNTGTLRQNVHPFDSEREIAVRLTFETADQAQQKDRYTIRSFSAGRTSLLALADDGTIWYWFDRHRSAVEITFPSIPHAKTRAADPSCRVKAGWQSLSVYLPQVGILIFKDPFRHLVANASFNFPRYPIMASSFAPPYHRVSKSFPLPGIDQPSTKDTAVVSHVLLEKTVVFATSSGKAYAAECPDTFPASPDIATEPLNSYELPLDSVSDIHGGFYSSFGIFQTGARVLVGHQYQLLHWINHKATLSNHYPYVPWIIIPALQNTQVVQLSFGDYHFLALHADGTITSYGNDPGTCGATGLNPLQGKLSFPPRQLWEPAVLPHGLASIGRRVIFHQSTHDWLGRIEAERVKRSREVEQQNDSSTVPVIARAEFGEWIEQQTRDWHRWPEVVHDNPGKEKVTSHFAVLIAAGGHSSGAIVLHDQEIDQKIAKAAAKRNLPTKFSVRLPSSGETMNPGWPELPWLLEPPHFSIRYTGNPHDSLYGLEAWTDS